MHALVLVEKADLLPDKLVKLPTQTRAMTPQQAGLAALYAAPMTKLCLDTLGNTGPIIIEGSFARSPAYYGPLGSIDAGADCAGI